MRLGEMLDGIGKRAAAPVLDAVHLAALGLDEALVAVEHAGHLLALVRMDQEHDFIMTHLWFPHGCRQGECPAEQPPDPESGGEARACVRPEPWTQEAE